MAQGETLWLLYLCFEDKEKLTESKRQLAITVAEHISLAVANLQLRETLQHQSIRDPLTGLFNRRYMEESLEREINRAQRKQQPLGIIMIDVDHFKRFNDRFGHEAGDIVLQTLGVFLRHSIRESDIACRYGGEELMLILPESPLEETMRRAEQIREGIKSLKLEHRQLSLGEITASMGVACFPEHGMTKESIIWAADVALYKAKAEGRDRVITAQL
jgi:diguanylate cyclase (GGDEF)-like protein